MKFQKSHYGWKSVGHKMHVNAIRFPFNFDVVKYSVRKMQNSFIVTFGRKKVGKTSYNFIFKSNLIYILLTPSNAEVTRLYEMMESSNLIKLESAPSFLILAFCVIIRISEGLFARLKIHFYYRFRHLPSFYCLAWKGFNYLLSAVKSQCHIHLKENYFIRDTNWNYFNLTSNLNA